MAASRMEQGSSRQLLSIQYLRAAAALMVVFHHIIKPGHSWFPGFEAGARGVDIFVVISGFVMYVAARDESFVEFWRRLITRIVPMYWLATAIFAGVMLYYLRTRASGTFTLKSLLFIPAYSESYPNHVWPLLVPGWTLNYEMFFYLLFSVGLLFKQVMPVTTILIVAFLAAGLLFESQSAAFTVSTSKLLLEFLSGLWLAAWADRPTISRLVPLLWIGAVGLLASDLLPDGLWPIEMSFAVAIVAGAVGYEQRWAVARTPLVRLLGDASYAIYLIHPSILWIAGAELQKITTGTPFMVVMLVTGCSLSVGLGVLLHLAIEKPLVRYAYFLSGTITRRLPRKAAT